jgi:hypothetical protein
MNFKIAFDRGQLGVNKGLTLGPGLERVSRAINGLQRGMIYGVASAPKVGKSTLVDSGFVAGPWMDAVEKGIEIEFIYLSYEIDRISKEFDFAAFFLWYDFHIMHITLPNGIKFRGESVIELSGDYLLGKLQDDNGNIIKVNDEIIPMLQAVYHTRIKLLFGDYDIAGNLVTKGAIRFIEDKDNPTGVRNNLFTYAEKHGKFKSIDYKDKTDNKIKQRIVGYTVTNPERYVVIITDHLRKLKPERGFQIKQTVDKMVEYQVELRNWCNYSFVDIIHLNRDMSDTHRMRMMGDLLYPTSDDIKDTGNLSEEANHVFTMFNPNDDKYNLRKHFGCKIKDAKGNQIYPKMRTIHLVESRHTYFPQHFKVEMFGGVKAFKHLKTEE